MRLSQIIVRMPRIWENVMRHARNFRSLVNLLTHDRSWLDRLKHLKIALFVDYDGTLTPVADRPELAKLDDSMRQILERLSKVTSLTIITGRDIHNVKRFVQLPELIYAGNHGLEIEGPGGINFQYEHEGDYLKMLGQVMLECQQRLASAFEGIQIELKKFTIAVHYRYVAEAEIKLFMSKIQEIVQRYSRLKLGYGKKVIEFRPNIDWDKGKAMQWIAEKLNLNHPDFFHIYVGDDITDEDAFRALPDTGMGILVSNHDQETYADFRLADTSEVKIFFEILLSLPVRLS